MSKFIKFYADWCGPCKTLSSMIGSLPESANLDIQSVNIDTEIDLAAKYSVRGLPTVVMLDDQGLEVRRLTKSPQSVHELREFMGI